MLSAADLKTRSIKLKILSASALWLKWHPLACLKDPSEEQFTEFHVLNEEVYRRKLHHLFCRQMALEAFRRGKARATATLADVEALCDG